MKFESNKICSVETCESEALSWSNPPLCYKHIEDIDSWYAHVQEYLKTIGLNENALYLYRSFAHSEYMAAISDSPIAEELYKDFEGRAEPPKNIAFSEEHFVTALAHFFITVAATGILENLSYDALKMGLGQVMTPLHKKADPKNDHFEEIVEEEKYEEIRKRFHLKMPFIEINRETEKKISEKYRHIVQEGFEKDSDLLFRPKRKEESDS